MRRVSWAADTLPGSVVFVSAMPSQGSCSPAAGLSPRVRLARAPFGTVVALRLPDRGHHDVDGQSPTPATPPPTSDLAPANDTDDDTTTASPVADLRIARAMGGVGGRGHVRDLHHHAYERRALNRGRRGDHPCRPGRDERLVRLGRLCHRGRYVHRARRPRRWPRAPPSLPTALGIPAHYALPSVSNTARSGRRPSWTRTPRTHSATDVDTVATSADLAITKTDAVDPVVLATTSSTRSRSRTRAERRGRRRRDGMRCRASRPLCRPPARELPQAAGIVTRPPGVRAAGSFATI